MEILNLPTRDGRQLWMVQLLGRYVGSDPGTGGYAATADVRHYVVARSFDEAISMVRDKLTQSVAYYGMSEGAYQVTATPMPLETLLAARSTQFDGHGGSFPTHPLAEVSLSGPNAKAYRLAVVLVEV